MARHDHKASPLIIARMLEGWDWFDNRMREQQRRRGYRVLNKTQSMMMFYVASGLTRPSDIARKISLSRQAVLHIAHQLVKLGFLEVKQDPNDGRSKVLSFSDDALDERIFAENVLKELEDRLEMRLGKEDMKTFRRLLSIAWSDDTAPLAKPVRRARRPETIEG